jgi:NAD(P)H-quinone oxidoreductase subunit 6
VNSWQPLIFFGLSGLVVVASLLIAFSKNLVYSSFALLGTFTGVAGYFILLGADFMAVAQVLVYIGGVMVLYLFAVLMTSGIADVKVTNRSIATKWALPAAAMLLILLVKLIYGTKWFVADTLVPMEPTTARIGDMLLTEYLLPFELGSILLLGVLVGAVALGRRGIREGDKAHG